MWKAKPKHRAAPWLAIASAVAAPQALEKAKALTQYRKEARAFVKHAKALGAVCPVVLAVPELKNGRRYGWPISAELNEVHHMRGRLGPLLNDKRFWLAVSKAGHRWIHQHPHAARQRGWLCQPGEWNKPVNN